MAQIIYGWLSGTGKQLYVYQHEFTWGVSYEIEKATPFESVEACKQHHRSKHCFQERYEHLLHNSTVKYFDQQTKQLALF